MTPSSSAGATVGPIQSSSAAYYPTGSAPSESGVAGTSSSAASTGFLTRSRPYGIPGSGSFVRPTGYSTAYVRPTGYGGY